MRDYYVYILASKSRQLYIGITNNLTRRLAEHRAGIDPDGHCYRHEIIRLVHVERTTDVLEAIRREKQLKRLETNAEDRVDRESEPEVAGPGFGAFASLRLTTRPT